MLTELRKNIDINTDHFNKELETTKMAQSKIDNSISGIEGDLKAMSSQLNNTEHISDLEDRIMEIT